MFGRGFYDIYSWVHKIGVSVRLMKCYVRYLIPAVNLNALNTLMRNSGECGTSSMFLLPTNVKVQIRSLVPDAKGVS